MDESDSVGDRVYARLKEDIASGRVSVHVRLDFAELAQRYDVSTTPIREAAMRLLGEGLLEVHPKGGLRPAHTREADLHALLELHERLGALALRWSRGIALTSSGGQGVATLGARRHFFAELARATANAEFVRVMARLDDRLERYARLDEQLLPDVDAEFTEMRRAMATPSVLGPLLRRYHKRRQALVSRSILLAVTDDADV